MTSINWPAIGAIILPNVGGWINSLITRENIDPWYNSLKKPDWSPPNWVFGPVWTVLYSSIGYGSYLVYRDGGGFDGDAKIPLIAYATNLVLNWAWTPIFFGAHNLKLAFYEILLVGATGIGTGLLFYKINPLAGYLFIPYVAWLGIATALSYSIYKDNPEAKITEIKDK